MQLTELNHRGSPPATTDEVMMIQETLKIKGLYRGEVDGMPGKDTMRAVRDFKRTQQLPINNSLNQEFVDYIRNEV